MIQLRGTASNLDGFSSVWRFDARRNAEAASPVGVSIQSHNDREAIRRALSRLCEGPGGFQNPEHDHG